MTILTKREEKLIEAARLRVRERMRLDLLARILPIARGEQTKRKGALA